MDGTLLGPAHAGKAKDGEEQHMLAADEGPVGGVLHGAQQLRAPGNQGEGVHVRVHWHAASGDLVGRRMVGVVLALPPVHAEAGKDAADQQPGQGVVLPVCKYLVVAAVVGEPAALLPEEAQQEGGGEEAKPGGPPQSQHRVREGGDADDAREQAGVPKLVGLEQAFFVQRGAELPEVGNHGGDLLSSVGRSEVAYLELGEPGPAGASVEGGKHISGVLSSIRVYYPPTGVVGCKIGHIVDLALEDEPAVLNCAVLLHLGSCKLLVSPKWHRPGLLLHTCSADLVVVGAGAGGGVAEVCHDPVHGPKEAKGGLGLEGPPRGCNVATTLPHRSRCPLLVQKIKRLIKKGVT
mmetsp:Transcript_8868/g.25557  ORF Transcript_8868/g.25557 Transcript_8868/m.25557 type:complete len:350 (-) Transcript_8868:42-1091(-)